MELTSPDFVHRKHIPEKYTCRGKGINPHFTMHNIPKKAESLVLIMEDPDAPSRIFIHWVLYNIPIQKEIEENSAPGLQGLNSLGEVSYFPPCPPSGEHRYFFRLYALDKMLELEEGATLDAIEGSMEGHILAKAELIGLYQKN